jgi:hypothetical protein
MSATKFDPVLPYGHIRAIVTDLTISKVIAIIETDRDLTKKTFVGDERYQLAKQWIKDNI